MEAIASAASVRRHAPWTLGTTVALGSATVVLAALLATTGAGVLLEPAQVATAWAFGAFLLVLTVPLLRGAPGSPAAPLLAAEAFVVTSTNALDTAAMPVLEGAWMLLYLPLAQLLLVMPDGRTHSRRWTAVGWAISGVCAAFLALCAIGALWPATASAMEPAALVLLPVFLCLLVACAVSPLARYRHTGEPDRLRLRWVLVAGLSLPLTLLLCWASYIVLGTPDLVMLGLIAMMLAIPTGATIALVAPRMFDIDRAIVTAVSALVLAAAALAALSVIAGIVGSAMDTWPPMAAAATGAAAMLAVVVVFPLVRRGFDRMLYPERARAVAGLRRLSAQVDAGADAPEELQRVLREALRDPELVIAYRRFADREPVGLDGGRVTVSDDAAIVRIRGEEIGAIIPSPDRARRPAIAVARAAAPLLDAIRSRSELALAAAEAEASRERLLRAGYEERRRLERDLHDGAQQRLVALGMRLRVLQRTAKPDDGISETLDAAVAELGTAVSELRRLAHGVRPGALDDGLGAALAELGRLSPETIELDVRAGELPDAVATTAYFVVSEAVANALRHSGARRVRVVVRHDDDVLQLHVSDDGCGGASARIAGGLAGLSDRVAALGGDLRVHSPAGAGTRIEAVLPCAS